jgi:hypothetical protein
MWLNAGLRSTEKSFSSASRLHSESAQLLQGPEREKRKGKH